jgi:hypothetical protein
VTIQNKVAPDEARRLLDDLSHPFQHFVIRATGLKLWSYEGGPWQFLAVFPFEEAKL